MRLNRTGEINKNLRILLVTPEIHPFARTGGLADMTYSYAKALFKNGFEIAVSLPFYPKTFPKAYLLEKLCEFEVLIDGEMKKGLVYKTNLEGLIPVFLIAQNDYFDRDGLYGDEEGDFSDNAERFAFFCKGLLIGLKQISWQPDIIHCNDWQTALIPLYLKTRYGHDNFYRVVGTLFTIHNLAYQGLFPKEKLKAIGFDSEFFSPEKLEFYGKVSLIKAGLVYADILNTVSLTYRQQIQTEECGCGLAGLLRERKDDLFGIVNGIDYEFWDTFANKGSGIGCFKRNLLAKRQVKAALQKENNFSLTDVPLISMVTRLVEQKGFDLIIESIDEIMKLPMQLIIMGIGNSHYHRILLNCSKRYPEKLNIQIGFDLTQAKRIFAGSDICLIPSKYEPCGLVQLIGMHYGTIPVVRKTGGLADTVKEFNPLTGQGNGFLFDDYSPCELIRSLKKAFLVYENKGLWIRLIKNAMKQDFSWNKPVKEYIKIYNIILNKIKKSEDNK